MAPIPPSSSSDDDLIAVGIVRRAHGVRGEASVEPWTDDPNHLGTLDEVVLVSPNRHERRACRVLGARPHGERMLLHFDGISSPEAVREHQQWTVEVPVSAVRTLAADEYYLHDLHGLVVIDSTRGRLGKVINAGEGGGGTLLEVERADGKTFDIPFVREFIRSVDLGSSEIRVDLPEGLDDLERAETVIEGSTDAFVSLEPARKEPVLTVDVVTIFPAMFDAVLEEGIIARAVRDGLLRINVHDLREFATDRHRSTDDEAYGGGPGMVMLAEPVFRCVEAITGEGERPLTIMMSPQGSQFTQARARELATRDRFILLCGRYEGFDERVRLRLVDEELSIGDYVVTGGELPAMIVMDAVGRMVEGVVGARDSVEADSFFNGLLDHPHYTRPSEFRGDAVPEVLLSGHAERIRKWRKTESIRATLLRRPDLLEGKVLDAEGRQILEALRRDMVPGEQSEPRNGSIGGRDEV